ERNFEMVKVFRFAVTNRAISEKGCVTFTARIDHRVLAGDIKIGFLLASETCLGQILGSGTAAHGDVNCAFPIALAKIPICSSNLLLYLFWKFTFQKKRAQCLAGRGQ